MKLQTDPKLPQNGDVNGVVNQLTKLWRNLAQQVNGLAEGSIVARHNALTAAPTQGTYGQGDFVPNKTPTELGAAGNKYIVTGWTCVTGGTPGTWVQNRTLTGN